MSTREAERARSQGLTTSTRWNPTRKRPHATRDLAVVIERRICPYCRAGRGQACNRGGPWYYPARHHLDRIEKAWRQSPAAMRAAMRRGLKTADERIRIYGGRP